MPVDSSLFHADCITIQKTGFSNAGVLVLQERVLSQQHFDE